MVFEKYEETIAGKYTDSEDFQQFVTQQIYKSRRVAESHFWVDGFDYMTPKIPLLTSGVTLKHALTLSICEIPYPYRL